MRAKFFNITNAITIIANTVADTFKSSVEDLRSGIKRTFDAVKTFVLTRKTNVQKFHSEPKPLLAEKTAIAIARRQKVRTVVDKISFAVLLWICRYKACKGKTCHTYKCGWLKRKFLSASGLENLCAEKKLTTKKDGKKITVSWLE